MVNLLEVIADFAPTGFGLQEAWFDPGFYDPDIDLGPTQGGAGYYRRLTQAESDLSPLVQERMQQLALYLYDKNPLAKRCLELIRDFVVGEGFSVSSKDEDIQKVLNTFWTDNGMNSRVHDMSLELGLFGEQFVSVFVNERSGHIRLTGIDPRAIDRVIAKPGQPDKTIAIRLLGVSGAEDKYIKVIAPNDDGLLVGAEPGERITLSEHESKPYYEPGSLNGSDTRLIGCLQWKINSTKNATRGRSDLLSVLDYMDLYDRLLFDEAERMSFLRAFVWDVTIKNADAGELKARALAEPPPKPGSVRYHNENETWAAISADLKSQESATTADLILSVIATGMGLPKTWINGIMDVNRASAASMDEPSLKRLRTRQLVVIDMVTQMVQLAIDQAQIAGVLSPAEKGEKQDFTVNVPEMSTKDMQKGAQSLFSFAQAAGIAKTSNWMDDKTAVQGMVLMLGQLGINVTAEELQDRLDEAKLKSSEEEEGVVPSYMDAVAGMKTPESSETAAAPPAVAGLDPQTMTGILTSINDSLVSLGNAGVIDTEAAQDIAAQMFATLGIKLDLAAMRKRLAAEKATADEAAAQQQAMM